jgi:hypothetical protein
MVNKLFSKIWEDSPGTILIQPIEIKLPAKENTAQDKNEHPSWECL